MRPRKRADRTTYRLEKIGYELDRMTQEKATLPAQEVNNRLRAIKERIEEMIEEMIDD